MRLINTTTHRLQDLTEDSTPPYGEVSFQDMQHRKHAFRKLGYSTKITATCEKAKECDLAYVWVDTCCIDKSSSAELQEAINSMYRWYEKAAICFVFLSDLDSASTLADWDTYFENEPTDSDLLEHELSKCAWFTRGWTLQEMIAPADVVFFDCKWRRMGTKNELLEVLSSITGVHKRVLRNADALSTISVADRMSWAARRRTTREEDKAYSLLGIFGVNLPML